MSDAQWEVTYDDSDTVATSTGCRVEFALFSNVCAHSRVLVCPTNADCQWSDWGACSRRLVLPDEERFTCTGDFNLDYIVDGHDFVIFRDKFRQQECLEETP